MKVSRLVLADVLKLPSAPPRTKFLYGVEPHQHAELRLPEGAGPFPVVVVIHGGCWMGRADAAYTAHLATALVREGWATWNLEYRHALEPGGGWPGTFLDVAHGIDALRLAVTRYPLDLDRVIALGHSAGGQLALWAGARHRVPRPSEVSVENPLTLRGVISLGGIADMLAYAAGGPEYCVEGLIEVMGGGPDRKAAARYRLVSPAELLPLGTIQILVWGDEDVVVPRSLFLDYEARARAAGDFVEVLNIENAGHHELCSAEGPAWAPIVAAVRGLLK